MVSNGFMIGPEIKKLFKIKVGTLIAEHPVQCIFPKFGVVISFSISKMNLVENYQKVKF